MVMPKQADKFLIIANSARMLAQAARDSGFIPFVIDCYGDQDTQKLAEVYQKVTSLQWLNLKTAVIYFKQRYGITQLIYGSGFELHSESLIFLAQYFKIMGNFPSIFMALHDKRDFFYRLQYLNIQYPEVCFTIPKKHEKWLIKPECSQGGLNIHYLSQNVNSKLNKIYYQRYIKGESLSVLFLANGKHAQIIGFNQQVIEKNNYQPF
jgi:methenyltetrahydromethanopterin cyclohydrolase